MFAVLAVIYVVFISLGLPDSLFGAAWPVVNLDFSVCESLASIYSIITGVCSGASSFMAGKLLRRFGTAKVTFVSILLTAFGLIGISFSKSFFIMMLFSLPLGFGAGAIDTGLNNYVSLHYKARHMNWLHCFWGIGVTISPLIMSAFLKNQDSSWKNGYKVIAAMQLAIAFIVLLVMKKWISLDNEIQEESTAGEKANIFKISGVISGILSLGFYCSMEFIVGTWSATYLVNTALISPDIAAKWVSTYYGGIMLGRLVSGFASIKASDKLLITSGLLISLFGFIMLALPLQSISFFGLILIGFGFGPIFPSTLHNIPERFGKKFSADITGLFMGGGYALGFAFQLIFGFVMSEITFKIMPFVLMIFAALTFLTNKISFLKSKQ